MTPANDHEREPTGDDLVAAEYVLGVLPAEERPAVARRVETEPAFARLVESWQSRLSLLDADYAEVEAPAAVKQALDQRLFAAAPSNAPAAPGLWQSLALWRGLAAAAVAALVIYAAVPLLNPTVETPAVQLVASLAADGSDVRYLAVYDPSHHRVGLSHVSGERATGRDFELWLIEGDTPPVSLGVIPVGAAVDLSVAANAAEQPDQGAVFAISLEPQGGSPTGLPTGPVVAAGDLKQI
jgi:anti-sigma-K factor RskA